MALIAQIEAADMNNNPLAGTSSNTGIEEGSELAALMAATGLSEAEARALWAEMGMGESNQPSQQQIHNQQLGGNGTGDNQALRVLMAQQQAAADQLRQRSAQTPPPSGGRSASRGLSGSPTADEELAAQEEAAVALELVTSSVPV